VKPAAARRQKSARRATRRASPRHRAVRRAAPKTAPPQKLRVQRIRRPRHAAAARPPLTRPATIVRPPRASPARRPAAPVAPSDTAATAEKPDGLPQTPGEGGTPPTEQAA
jgi:hypothetical protein